MGTFKLIGTSSGALGGAPSVWLNWFCILGMGMLALAFFTTLYEV